MSSWQDRIDNKLRLTVWLDERPVRWYAIPDDWYKAMSKDKERITGEALPPRPSWLKWLSRRSQWWKAWL